MKLCTSFGTRLGTQVRYSSAFYMTSAEHEVKDSRRSGIVSKLHSDVTQKEKSKGICMAGYSEKYHLLLFLRIHN